VEEFFHESIESVTDEGYIIIKLSYPEDEWVYSMILGYGNYVEVVTPLHIREIIADRLRKSLKIYDSN
jgi:predicted DNA-binding transcriptional regulator YafY